MILYHFISNTSLSSFFLSTIDVFNVFSYRRVITLIQARKLLQRIFKFDMYSFVIKTATDANRAVLDDMIIPALGLRIDKVLELIVEADPNKTSVIITIPSFHLMIYISSYQKSFQFF